MRAPPASSVALAVVAASLAVAACVGDPYAFGGPRTGVPSDGGGGGTLPDAGEGTPEEQRLFAALHPELEAKCGGVCHTAGTYPASPGPPAFLAGPAPYTSIKAQPGVVVADPTTSTLVTKGPHAGPAVASDAAFEERVLAWLRAEAFAIQAVPRPTIDPVSLTEGANELDLTKAASAGAAGVKLRFTAKVLGGMLQLSDVVVVAPAGSDVHIVKPRFVRVLGQPGEGGKKEVPDPADSFSNVDVTLPGGKTSPLPPGFAIFSGDGFAPFDLANDKLRIEVDKLEPGTVTVGVDAACKDVAAFRTNVLPSLRGAGVANINCAAGACHADGLAGMSLANADADLVCAQVRAKLRPPPDVASSVLVTRVTDATPHTGGKVADANAWRALFTDQAGVFF